MVFKEPAGGMRPWLLVLIGCYFFVETIFFREGLSDRLVFAAFGAALLCMGVADLLPRSKTMLAGWLRLACVALIVTVFVAQVVGFFSA